MHPSQQASRMDWKAKQGLSRQFQSRSEKLLFHLLLAALNIKKMTRENQNCSRRSSDVCLCSKTFCCNDSKRQKYRFSSEWFIKRALEDSGDGLMVKYRQKLDEEVKLKSKNRGFETIKFAVAIYEKETQQNWPKILVFQRSLIWICFAHE